MTFSNNTLPALKTALTTLPLPSSLADKSVLILGGSMGIGYALAQLLPKVSGRNRVRLTPPSFVCL